MKRNPNCPYCDTELSASAASSVVNPELIPMSHNYTIAENSSSAASMELVICLSCDSSWLLAPPKSRFMVTYNPESKTVQLNKPV